MPRAKDGLPRRAGRFLAAPASLIDSQFQYSPQTIETSDSNEHPLVTIPNLGQAPSFPKDPFPNSLVYRLHLPVPELTPL